MKRILASVYFIFSFTTAFAASSSSSTSTSIQTSKTTAVIFVPMQHKAMDQIVLGFREEALKLMPDLEVKVVNAQGDSHVLRSMLQQALHKNIDFFLPIGTQTTQMAVSLVKDKPVIALAALPFKHKNCMSMVDDEIGVKDFVGFLSKLPRHQHLSLVHSSSEKVMPIVKSLKQDSLKLGIELQTLMVHSQPEIISAIKALHKDTQGIVMLKDHLVVSGVSILAQEAKKRQIPVISSDEGSLQAGAHLAFGVHEADIGRKGAILVKRIRQKENLCQHVESFQKSELKVFFQPQTLGGLGMKSLDEAQKLFSPYKVVSVTP